MVDCGGNPILGNIETLMRDWSDMSSAVATMMMKKTFDQPQPAAQLTRHPLSSRGMPSSSTGSLSNALPSL